MATVSNQSITQLTNTFLQGRSWHGLESVLSPGGGITEELYKKDLHGPDNHDGMITQLGPDTLECEVK